MKKTKKKKIVAYLDGKKLVDDVIQAAAQKGVTVDDLKEALRCENPGHQLTFVVK